MAKNTHQTKPTKLNTGLDADKNAFVHGTFIRTADHNYITARWCFAQKMNVDFFWLSVHALEKYMKAVLLLNGRSSMNYGHDLPKLYEAINEVVGENLPDTLECPDELKHVGEIAWIDETPAQFMERLYDNGNAHNRYLIYGLARQMTDVHKVDIMVFQIRRLCRKMEGAWAIRPKSAKDQGQSNADILKSKPDYWEISQRLPLERAFTGKDIYLKSIEEIQRVLLNVNFAFAPEGYEHRHVQLSLMSSNPEILRALRSLEHDSSDEDAKAEAREMGRWLLDNVFLPNAVKDHIKKLMADR